jgi:hypothetical protein
MLEHSDGIPTMYGPGSSTMKPMSRCDLRRQSQGYQAATSVLGSFGKDEDHESLRCLQTTTRSIPGVS